MAITKQKLREFIREEAELMAHNESLLIKFKQAHQYTPSPEKSDEENIRDWSQSRILRDDRSIKEITSLISENRRRIHEMKEQLRNLGDD